MNLKDQVAEKLKEAMRAKDAERVQALRFLLAQIKDKEIALRPKQIVDMDVLSVLQKQIKQRQASIEQFQSAQRPDLVQKESRELAILREFLPTPLSQEELSQIVDEVILTLKQEDLGKRLMGQVVKTVMSKTKGRADSKTISEMVKTKL